MDGVIQILPGIKRCGDCTCSNNCALFKDGASLLDTAELGSLVKCSIPEAKIDASLPGGGGVFVHQVNVRGKVGRHVLGVECLMVAHKLRGLLGQSHSHNCKKNKLLLQNKKC